MTETRRLLIDGVVTRVSRHGDRFVTADGRAVDVATATHLPPCTPTKIICVHLSYRSRIEQLGAYSVETPTYFHKPVSCLNSHRGTVLRPRGTKYLNLEGEVGVVIGRTTRCITPERAPDHIAGYTIANDYGLHDFRDTDANSMLRVKGTDTLGVVGPGLVTDWDPRDKRLRTVVNGEIVQEDTTAGMLWDMNYLVADLARLITLEPGDLILTGTPANSRPVQPGDTVTVEVEGLGELTSRIAEGPPVMAGFGAMPTDSATVRGVALGTGLVK
ncbi:fumarylacetoacetate hydrolase family protein [Rhizomonospora bruguierae]|uniref:fumarylacetoacetate hydrolase family protein n=1 Tax=Rhizomonospora bruguierae TaxID=1581705 RepID=UPI001BCC612B|nr:fumarylacetoacetate hydrolase family protein [Micromonospora sp. NBRC 107566]